MNNIDIKPTVTDATDNKRQAIVAAAESVFLENGYSNTSMDMIAQVAQVTKRTMYKKFANKEDLFFTVVLSRVDDIYEQVSIQYDSSLEFRPQLINIIQVIFFKIIIFQGFHCHSTKSPPHFKHLFTSYITKKFFSCA